MSMSLFSRILLKLLGAAPYTTAVIAAAGSSARMDGQDKLFIKISDIPVLAHTLMVFERCALIDEIIIVTRKESIESVARLCANYHITKATKIMAGGATRLESVMNGVFAVSWKTELVAIHDGARPCIDERIIERTILRARKRQAVAPGIPVSSTIKKVNRNIVTETMDRSDLIEIQTPQVFNADLIKGALTKAKKDAPDITDDCMAAELMGVPVHVTQGSRNNIKLTTGEDVVVAEAIIAQQMLRRIGKE
ncbi:MAG: 2-C-methyl-D-erythritol 4-phosphate cytidylyltransferase [Oscillospiraceae bacterium]|nr:2-C-methyl-D-erythritol 4-phosphate cytidylyltransferase [Oscillospiraceae bacterium]